MRRASLEAAGLMAATRFSRTNAAMFSIAAVAAAWQAALAATVFAADARSARIWAKVASAFAAFIAPAVYQFVANILRRAGLLPTGAVIGSKMP